MATRRKALVDGEEGGEGNASDAEPGADDCALQREGDWHAGGEVLGTSNPGDCPYDPDDCPGIEVVGSEAGRGRRPCARRRPPRTACQGAVSRTAARVPGEASRFRDAAVAECAFPSRRGAREVWGNPPARLRCGLRGGSQISAWRLASRKGAVCVAARTQSALFGETRIQSALFRKA